MTATIITKDELHKMFEEEAKTGREYIYPINREEQDGLLYSIWEDKRNGKQYATREIRTVHMGFNSNEEGKLEEFIAIVEREGACEASWGVTGRTMHAILAHQLAEKLPQYAFEIDYNYACVARKKETA